MKKRFWTIFASALLGVFMLASCNGGNAPTETLTLSEESITLTVLEEYALVAQYDGSESITWSSSDVSVVTVDNDGNLVAEKEGTATITATAGETTDTCEVLVAGYNTDYLELDFTNPQMLLYTNEVKPSGVILKYAGKVLDIECQKAFASNDTSVVTVDGNGNVTAVGVGNAIISASFMVSGTTVSGTLNVNVQNKGSVAIAQNSATIYAVSDLGYSNMVALNATAYELGQPVSDATIVWSVEEQDVISISSEGVVTALNAGTAMVTATYTNAEGNHTDSIEVTVLPLQKTVEKPLVVAKNRINNVLTVDLEEITGDNERTLTNVIVSDSEDNTLVTLANGELDFTSVNGGYMTMVLETRNVVYSVSLELFDVAIATVEEFKVLGNNADLWYCLEGDIDLSGIENWADNSQTSVMSGVLDGKGYKITGLKLLSGCGLFKELNGATIKNLNVIDACVGGQSGVFAYRVKGEKNVIDNVYISIKKFSGQYVGGMIGRVFGSVEVKNSFVYFPETQSAEVGFIGGYSQNNAMVTNCVFVGGNKQVMGIRQDQIKYKVDPVVDENTIISTALEAHKTYSSNLGNFYETYNTNHPYLALNNANFTLATMKSLSGHIVELTEDITLTDYTGTTSGVFRGVFEGNGHKITGLKLAKLSGLFYQIDGATIKNVKIINVEFTNHACGVIAYMSVGSATSVISNVYISVSKWSGETANYEGGIVGTTKADAKIVAFEIIDSVICVPTTTIAKRGILRGTNDTTGVTVGVTNCVFVTDGEPVWGGSKLTLDSSFASYAYNRADGEVTEEVLEKMGSLRATYEANYLS